MKDKLLEDASKIAMYQKQLRDAEARAREDEAIIKVLKETSASLATAVSQLLPVVQSQSERWAEVSNDESYSEVE